VLIALICAFLCAAGVMHGKKCDEHVAHLAMLHAALTSSLAADRGDCDVVMVLLPDGALPAVMAVCALRAPFLHSATLAFRPLAPRAHHHAARTHARCAVMRAHSLACSCCAALAVPRGAAGAHGARRTWLPYVPSAVRIRRRDKGGRRGAGANVHAAAALPALRAAGAARRMVSESR
jgi:hypothetical protein